MSKAILIAIKPQWVAKILNGEKTIEIRKTMPKCELPIDVYIYCTKDIKHELVYVDYTPIGNKGYMTTNLGFEGEELNGKVVAKFTLRKCRRYIYSHQETVLKNACLTIKELLNYTNNNLEWLYCWHIEDLVIFDEPKELSSFCKVGCIEKLENYIKTCPIQKLFQREMPEEVKQWVITKAPQNFCYIESGE